MIVDAHVHLPVYDGLGTLSEKRTRLLADASRDGVDFCVLISDSELESDIGSMKDCVRLFSGSARVRVVGGISPLIDYEAQLELLRGYLASGDVVGVKLFPGHEKFYLSDPRLAPVWRLAMENAVPVLFHSGWENSFYASPKEAETVLRAWPGLKLVCCHCFYPEINWCFQLIRYPDLMFDLSSVADDPQITERIIPDLRRLIALCPDRVMFGSDYASCERGPHLALIEKLKLSEQIREKVMYRNACGIYRIKV